MLADFTENLDQTATGASETMANRNAIATIGTSETNVDNVSNVIQIRSQTISENASKRLKQYPLANKLLTEVLEDEANTRTQLTMAKNLRLTDKGELQVQGESYYYSASATNDLALLAGIPAPFLAGLDHDLQAINFNRLLPKKTPSDEALTIVWNGNIVERIHRGELSLAPRGDIIEAILNQAPRGTIRDDIHAITYALNGHVDLSLVTGGLNTEPKPDDIVCGGVHLTIETSGAIQIGSATFRLRCLNGAMALVCFGEAGHVRLRRGDGKNSQANVLRSVGEFAQRAWRSWKSVSDGLALLVDEGIETADIESLVARLRQSPFFISAAVAKHVREALAKEAEKPTMYDLFNAITSVGTHRDDLPARHRYRLRLGAGHLTTHGAELCSECKQLRIGKSRPQKTPPQETASA